MRASSDSTSDEQPGVVERERDAAAEHVRELVVAGVKRRRVAWPTASVIVPSRRPARAARR